MEKSILVGHFAVGFIAKRAEPKISLGTLFLAVMTADFLWCVFMLAGLEHVQFRPGRGAANYFVASDIALSHSLLTNAVWGILFALAYLWRRRYIRGAWLLGLAVMSHWFLDFISHRPDMPLAPGVTKYFGLGLWTSIWATILIEGGLWVFAIIIYLRSTKPKKPPWHTCLLAVNSLPDPSLVWKYRRATTLTRLRGSPELGFLRPDCGVGLLDQPAAPGANLVPIPNNQSGRTERAAELHPMSSPHSNSPNAAGGSDG